MKFNPWALQNQHRILDQGVQPVSVKAVDGKEDFVVLHDLRDTIHQGGFGLLYKVKRQDNPSMVYAMKVVNGGPEEWMVSKSKKLKEMTLKRLFIGSGARKAALEAIRSPKYFAFRRYRLSRQQQWRSRPSFTVHRSPGLSKDNQEEVMLGAPTHIFCTYQDAFFRISERETETCSIGS